MKVTVKQQPEEFKPVTLEITLDSKDELEAFSEVCGHNMTVTKATPFVCETQRKMASDILSHIYDDINKSINL